MPLYRFVCPDSHATERLAPFSCESVTCDCGQTAPRVQVNRIIPRMARMHGEKLSNYFDEAREMEYQVNQSDDPYVQEHGINLAHAAKVRAEARLQAGATHYLPNEEWNHKEVD